MVASTPAEAFAQELRRAADNGTPIAIRGAGTKFDWARTAPPTTSLSTLGLNRLIAHEHGDLTATIEAGMSLHDVNAALARHHQWLPFDPSFADNATIGGILATNDAGPLRHRYGTPRDLVIGIHLATSDGRLAKAGGQVVKNVAGYDLGKLVTGSFGSLAAIVSATFKLSPLPAASATLVIEPRGAAHAGEIVRDIMASQVEPIAFEIGCSSVLVQAVRPAMQIVLRFASVPAAVAAQIEGVSQFAILRGCTTSTVDGEAETVFWRQHNARIWSGTGAVMRANWLPANTSAVTASLQRCTTSNGDSSTEVELVGRAVVGAGLIRIGGDADGQMRAIERLHGSGVLGNIVVLRGSAALKERWGVRNALPQLTASLKRAFDPAGILA